MCVSVSPLRAAVLAFMSLVLVSCGGGSSPTAPSGQQAGGDLDINLRPLAARQNSPIIPIEIQIPPTDAEDDIPAYIHIGYRIGLGGSQPLRLMTAAAGTLDLNNRNTIVDIPPDGRELVFFWDALEDLGPDADLDTVVIRAGILRANGSPAREAVCDFQPVIRVNFGATADCPTDAPMLEGERLDPATVGVPYQDRIEAEGGEPPLRYELINRETGEPTGTNSLGFGLFLNETTGEITGTPTAGAPELLTFVVRVTDSCGDDVNTGQRTGQQAALPEGRFDQAQFELPITGGQPVECEADPPAITTTELPDGTQGEPYDFQLEATGGEGTLAWSGEGFTGAGLSVDPNGRIGGTPNTFGTFSVTAIVRDACETPQEDRQSFILDIACAAPPSFATCGGEARMGQGVTACRLPDAFLGSVYSTTIAVNSPAGFDGFSVDGDLPAGLIVTTDATSGDASATLTISGTPTDEGQTGVDFLFELRIVDACGQERRQFYAIRLNPVSNCPEPGPQIENPTGTLPGGEAGSAYSAPITVTGGTPPVGPVTVVDGGGTNLTIGADGRTLEGTLPAEGTYTLVLAVSDACAPPRSDQETFTLTVFAPCTPLEITTTPPLPVGIVGSPYSVDLMASGGTGALTWALAPRSAPLPDGLTISAAGTISGTPTAAGTFDFRVRVEDACPAGPQAALADLSITIEAATCGEVTITTKALPDPQLNAPYSATVEAEGGQPPYMFEVTAGTLPRGLAIDADTGEITGTPDDPGEVGGTFRFTVTATDTCSPTPGTGSAEFEVSLQPGEECEPLVIENTGFPDPQLGVSYNATLMARGESPFAWELVNGSLPAGLSVDATGSIVGQPSDDREVGQCFTFTLQVADACTPKPQTATADFGIRLQPAPTCDPLSIDTGLPDPELNRPYNEPLQAFGGVPPYTWVLVSGNLPSGLVVTPEGFVTGTPNDPKQEGSEFTFEVQVSDSCPLGAQTDRTTLSVTLQDYVCATHTITNKGFPDPVLESPYDIPLMATGEAPFTWRLSDGSLPVGMSVDPSGLLSGRPTDAREVGTEFTFTLEATDSCLDGPQVAMATYAFTLQPQDSCMGQVMFDDGRAPADPVVGVPYTFIPAVSGGLEPYIFDLSGDLPDGLSFDPGTGTISGIATTAGQGAVASINVQDSCKPDPSRDSLVFAVVVQSAEPPCPPADFGIHVCTTCPGERVTPSAPGSITLDYTASGFPRADRLQIDLNFSDPRIRVDPSSFQPGTIIPKGGLLQLVEGKGGWLISYDGPPLTISGPLATFDVQDVDACNPTVVLADFGIAAAAGKGKPEPVPAVIEDCSFEAQ